MSIQSGRGVPFTHTSSPADSDSRSAPSSTANLGGMKVKVGDPNDVKSSASSHPPEVLDSKSQPSEIRSILVGHQTEWDLDEEYGTARFLTSRGSGAFPQSLTQVHAAHRGAWLLSVALGNLEDREACNLCTCAVEELVKADGKHAEAGPMALREQLLEDLESARAMDIQGSDDGWRSGEDAERRLQLVRSAVSGRVGEHLGIPDIDDVEVANPKDAKSAASSHPPEVLDSTSQPSVIPTDMGLALNVPKKLPLPHDIRSVLVGNKEEWGVDEEYGTARLISNRGSQAFTLSIPEGDPVSQGAWLLSIALGTLNETQAIYLCMCAVDKLVKPDGKHAAAEPMTVLRNLMGGLESAQGMDIQGEEEGWRAKDGDDGKQRLELVRFAVACRAGKYLGIRDTDEASRRSVEYHGKDADEAAVARVRADIGTPFRFAFGDYGLAMDSGTPDQQVAKMLIVAMNQALSGSSRAADESIQSAYVAVIEQIEQLTNPDDGLMAFVEAAIARAGHPVE